MSINKINHLAGMMILYLANLAGATSLYVAGIMNISLLCEAPMVRLAGKTINSIMQNKKPP